jgi:hypothetical protein
MRSLRWSRRTPLRSGKLYELESDSCDSHMLVERARLPGLRRV